MPEIWFPNLGIEIGKVSEVAINIFGLKIYWYGVIITFGIIVAILLAMKEAKRTGQNSEMYFDFLVALIVLSIVGARVYYVVFSWDDYKDNLLSVFNTRQGGLAIYGGVLTGLIVSIIFAKKKKINIGVLLDTLAPSVAIGQAIGRWGNFINREAFGGYTDSLFAMRYIKNQVSGALNENILNNTIIENGVEYIQVHPTFLYESLWNIGVFIILTIYKKHKKFNGEVVALYFLLYGIGRAWIEGLRTDQLKFMSTNIAVSQVLSVVIVIFSLIYILYNRFFHKEKKMVSESKNEPKNEVLEKETQIVIPVKKSEVKLERFFIGSYGDLSINIVDVNFINKSYEIKQSIDIKNASYLAFAKNKKYLYCVNEIDDVNDKKGGTISAFKVRDDGTIGFINFVYSLGESPCHLSLSDDDKFLFAANYGGGSFVVYKINDDGTIGELLHNLSHSGKSINKERQDKSHIHFIRQIPFTNKLIVCDLGEDKVYIYKFSEDFKDLLSCEELSFTPGAGPRHLVLSLLSEEIFIVNELNLTIDSFKYNREEDSFEHFKTTKIENQLNSDYSSAAIKILNDESQVFVSVRGKDVVVGYENKNGELKKFVEFSALGKSPRDITFSSDEKYLLCACQESNVITIFEKNENEFKNAGFNIKVEKPTCIIS